MSQMIQVPKEEFQSLKREMVEIEERLEILMDRELMAQLIESEKDIKEGRVQSLEEVKKELGF